MEDKNFFVYSTISNIGKLVLLINVILYLKSLRKFSKAFKTFTYYLLFILIIQITTGYLRWHKIPNIHYSHYYFVGQFLFLSLFYLQLESKKVFKKSIKIIALLVLLLLGIFYIKNPNTYFKFNIFEIVITSVPLIVYSFYFFIKKIDSKDKKFIYLNSGFFIYLSCSTLIFVAGNVPNSTIKMFIWYSNIILYLIYQILVFIEWYINFRKPKLLTSEKKQV